jgi:signal transduction histidine kinase
MIPYKHWKLRSKILFAAVVPFIMAVVISIPFLTNKSVENIEEKAKAYVEESAYSNSIKIEADIEQIATQVKVIARVLEATAQAGFANREEANVILKNIAQTNPSVVGIWTVWEPNKFDGKDAEFVNRDGHDETGRFIPYWTRETGELKLRALRSYNSAKQGNYHAMCKDAKKEILLTPYQYHVANKELMITTVAYPIFDSQNNFIASVGMDFDLSEFQNVIDEIKPFDIGFASIIGDDGRFIASSNKEEIGTQISERKYHWQHIRRFLSKGEFFTSDVIDKDLKQKIYRVVAPIKMGKLDASWGLMVTLPLDPIKQDVYKNLSMLMVVLTICFLLGVSVSLVTAKNIASPITQISQALERISSGNNAVLIPEIDSYDEIGLMASAAHVFKENAVELVNAKDKAEAANKSKTEFLANMSHELRTPMHAMLSYSKLGLEKIEDKESKPFKYFYNIHNSGERLLRLVNNLLDLSKLEAGKMEFNFTANDISKCIDQVKTELASLVSEKGIVIKVDNKLTDNSLIFDTGTIVQVLINIISNAIKFSPNNGEIFLKTSDDKLKYKTHTYPAILIEIQDQGIGIPEDELALVFDKFTQSSKTNKGSGGTGLGLSIAYSIVTAHHGKIWAENGIDRGAVIKILLPRNLNQFNEEVA